MILSESAEYIGTNHLFERLLERVTHFDSRKEALRFCKRSLVNREPSYTIYDGAKKSKVISDDLVFILDVTDSDVIKIITVYNYEEPILN